MSKSFKRDIHLFVQRGHQNTASTGVIVGMDSEHNNFCEGHSPELSDFANYIDFGIDPKPAEFVPWMVQMICSGPYSFFMYQLTPDGSNVTALQN